MIKAIDTEYNGYKFRSRLEARWAVYFDTLGIEYEYEKEGYVLPDGTKYLPDFWLPEYKTFAEVKPELFSNEEYKKCFELSVNTNCRCLLLDGVPEIRPYDEINPFLDPPGIYYCSWISKEAVLIGAFFKTTPERYIRDDIPSDLIKGVKKAKSARFEFGKEG